MALSNNTTINMANRISLISVFVDYASQTSVMMVTKTKMTISVPTVIKEAVDLHVICARTKHHKMVAHSRHGQDDHVCVCVCVCERERERERERKREREKESLSV